ncbi:MAG TPA: recombinase family protein [Actinomycetota bacterium]|nr:recombinase family protein [Actinomycetota bacterium]
MHYERAIGYARVSTAEQVQGFGLEVQERAIREWARSNRIRLLGVERDEGAPGSNGLDQRPGLARALARLEAGQAECLVVYRLDRLARDLVLQETTVRRLERRGRRVVSVTEPSVDGDDPTRILVRQVLGALAQYERAVIQARMAAGREAKRARGGYVGGRPPYGFLARRGALEPVPEEQAAIALARELRRRGASYREIARRLSEAGYAPKGGGVWWPAQVGRLLAGPRGRG